MAQGQGGGGERASPRLTSLMNKGAFLHTRLGGCACPTAAATAESAVVFFFFFLTFLHFSASPLVPDL